MTRGSNDWRLNGLHYLSTGLVLVMIGRLFYVSVITHGPSLAKAAAQYTVNSTLEAKRGLVQAQNYLTKEPYPLALNDQSYNLIADPRLIRDKAAAASALASQLQLPVEEIQAKIADDSRRYVVLAKRLTPDQADALEALKLKGLTLQAYALRVYPEGSLASQVIGFINGEGKGQYGLERAFDEDLHGLDGVISGQKDAKRRVINAKTGARAKNGTNFTITIDNNIQFMVEKILAEAVEKFKADSGSVVLLEVKTGAVLALANYPTFDLNKFGEVKPEQLSVFGNAAISGSYEPGSIFKTFTLAAGLDAKAIEPGTVFQLGCEYKANDFVIRNAEAKCYNTPNLTEVLAESINLGTIEVANRLGNEKFMNYLGDFGFGSKSGFELQPEAGGKIPLLRDWRDVTRATISFGQGLTTSPLQIAAAYAAIANQGKLMRPYLVASRQTPGEELIITSPKELRQAISPEAARQTTDLLEQVVLVGHGKRAAVPGYRIAGKTGTAQVVGNDGKYEANAHIGSFAGFFPADAPRFALLVKLDRPKTVEFAESSAAPTFGQIAAWLLHYAKIPPTLSQ